MFNNDNNFSSGTFVTRHDFRATILSDTYFFLLKTLNATGTLAVEIPTTTLVEVVAEVVETATTTTPKEICHRSIVTLADSIASATTQTRATVDMETLEMIAL